METKKTIIEPLIERIKTYGNTTIELTKLKTVEKTADVSSTFLSRSLFVIAISAFAIMLNITVALWLGDMLGENYLGFLAVAAFDGLIAIALYVIHPTIKSSLNNSIIKQLLN